jgi:hypothetical protein
MTSFFGGKRRIDRFGHKFYAKGVFYVRALSHINSFSCFKQYLTYLSVDSDADLTAEYTRI